VEKKARPPFLVGWKVEQYLSYLLARRVNEDRVADTKHARGRQRGSTRHGRVEKKPASCSFRAPERNIRADGVKYNEVSRRLLFSPNVVLKNTRIEVGGKQGRRLYSHLAASSLAPASCLVSLAAQPAGSGDAVTWEWLQTRRSRSFQVGIGELWFVVGILGYRIRNPFHNDSRHNLHCHKSESQKITRENRDMHVA
jgi:hypothetical protein